MIKQTSELNSAVIPEQMPKTGLGEEDAFRIFDHEISRLSAKLGAPDALAHMDPSPLPIASKLVALNAEYNQNLLHPSLSPFATVAETRVIDWLAPYFGMSTGHMCAGSTIANLTALWAAREKGAISIIASKEAHISIAKSAAILNMPIEFIDTDNHGRIQCSDIKHCEKSAVVLTAGTTGRGVIDPLEGFNQKNLAKPLWLHVDAAWAGPLVLTKHKQKLRGIELADSVSVSAHKWLFQPKDSAFVLFRGKNEQESISFGGDYLAAPNIGVQGSRSASGVALLGTLLALGLEGVEYYINKCIKITDTLAQRLQKDPRTELKQLPESGVLNWRPSELLDENKTTLTEQLLCLLDRSASSTKIDGELWIRHVSANIHADVDVIFSKIDNALKKLSQTK